MCTYPKEHQKRSFCDTVIVAISYLGGVRHQNEGIVTVIPLSL